MNPRTKADMRESPIKDRGETAPVMSQEPRPNKLNDPYADVSAILDSMPDAIAIVDPDGKIVRCNCKFSDTAKMPMETVIGRSLEAFLPRRAEDPVGPFNLWRTNGALTDYQAFLKSGNDKPLAVSIRASTFPGGNPKEAKSIWIFHDLTESRKLHEESLQTSKMNAIGQLAGGIAHDFNNLLTVILGNAEMAITEVGDQRPASDLLKEVKKAAKHASALTSQLLAFGRRQTMRLETIRLPALIQDLLPILRRMIGEDIDISLDYGAGPLSVHADPNQMRQVIINLAVNARDAMSQGGEFIIWISNDERPPVTPNDSRPATGAWVRVSLIDTGSGMNPETLKKIFEPFFTTKEIGRGTGLGLSVVHGIIEQHGGRIHVKSEVGRGTRFDIYLPAVEETGKIIPQEDSETQRLSCDKNVRLMFVEDEESLRQLGHRIFQNCGYSVESLSDPSKALQRMKELDFQYDLLVTDVVMPGISGKELRDRVHQLCPRMKVLFTSGYTENILADHGVQIADDAFLPKPYAPSELIHRVQEVLHA